MKAIYLILVALVLFSMFFGCTQTSTDADVNAPKVSTQQQADDVTSDVSTNISGINSTLDEIDSSLSE